MHFLAPALVEYACNGDVVSRAGNADRDLAPHGLYPAAGEDRWVAIACQDDEAWPALCRVLGRDDLGRDPGLREAAGRRARADELDAAVAAWTAERTAEAAEESLQAVGVAVHAVNNSAECLTDPHLAARGHFVTVARSDGNRVVERTRFRLSRTPPSVGVPPLRGQHTDHVLGEVLDYPAERIAELRADGVLT